MSPTARLAQAVVTVVVLAAVFELVGHAVGGSWNPVTFYREAHPAFWVLLSFLALLTAFGVVSITLSAPGYILWIVRYRSTIAAARTQASGEFGALFKTAMSAKGRERALALRDLAVAQADAAEREASRATLAAAVWTASATDGLDKAEALAEIAAAQARVGDLGASRATLATALEAAQNIGASGPVPTLTMPDTLDAAGVGWQQARALAAIAAAQVRAEGVAAAHTTFDAALETARAIKTTKWRELALADIAAALAAAGDFEAGLATARRIDNEEVRGWALEAIDGAWREAGEGAWRDPGGPMRSRPGEAVFHHGPYRIEGDIDEDDFDLGGTLDEAGPPYILQEHWAERERAQPSPTTTRLTEVSFPERVAVGAQSALEIRILLKKVRDEHGEVIERQAARPHDTEVVLELPELPAEPDEPPPEMVVDVLLHAPLFDVEGERRGVLRVPVFADSDVLRFVITATEAGDTTLAIDFVQAGRALGSVLVPVRVGESIEEAAAFSPLGGEFVLGAGEPVDLTLFIHAVPVDEPRYLYFTLYSPRPDLELTTFPTAGVLDLGKFDPRGLVADHLAELDRLATSVLNPKTVAIRLAGIGDALYERALPPEFKKLYVPVHDKVQSFQIYSDETWIPWELVRPVLPGEGPGGPVALPFWGEGYQLARWFRGAKSPQPILRLRRGCIVPVDVTSSSSSSASEPPARLRRTGRASEGVLTATDEAHAVLQAIHPAADPALIVTDISALYDALEAGGFDFLHIACHGKRHSALAELDAIELVGGRMTPTDLTPPYTQFAADRPLVFLNACETAHLDFSDTRVRDWADQLIKIGCGAFVGSIWPVSDELARPFAQAFYEGLSAGLPLGEAFQLARLKIRDLDPADPTWLAYCLYGDPLARVERTGPATG